VRQSESAQQQTCRKGEESKEGACQEEIANYFEVAAAGEPAA